MNRDEAASAAPVRGGDGVGSIAARLAALRAQARAALVASAGLGILAIVLGVVLSAALVDYLVRTPDWLRTGLWALGLGALVWLVRQRVRPAWRFKPPLTEVALRVERSPAGRAAGLEGVLASALELAQEPARPEPPFTRALAAGVVRQAGERWRGFNVSALLEPRALRRSGLSAGGAALACLVAALLAGPALTGTAAARVLTPWMGAQWPKRTELADATALVAHPVGQALPLRAALTRTDQGEGRTRITARYRTILDGEEGPTRRVLLTSQGRRVPTPAGPEGELFERLIEPEVGPAVAATSAGAAAAAAPRVAELEYWFETGDDQTAPTRVRLVEPPAVVSARAEVTPPAYAAGAAGAEGPGALVSGARELGGGTDARAIVGPVLAGSRVRVDLTFNKPVPGPGSPDRLGEVLARSFPESGLPETVDARFDGATWTLAWEAAGPVRLAVRVRDEFGLAPREEASFAVEVVADKPPAATVVEPREDEAVLPTAVVEVAGEGRDDVGLASVWLSAQRATPPAGSVGAAAEPAGEEKELARWDRAGAAELSAARSVSATLELAPMDLKPGEEVWLKAWAVDAYERDGARREPTASSVRRLRIISEERLVEQVRRELGDLRRAAIRMDAEQGELQRPVAEGAVSPDDRRRQAGLAPRLAQQRAGVERLQERVERNRLEDEQLRDMLGELADELGKASPAADRAAAAMEGAAQRAAEPGAPEPAKAELNEQEKRDAAAEQEAVREALGRVAELLDRGEDTWMAARSLQRLLEQQRRVQAQTKRLGERTVGQRAADLAPQEKRELDQLAEQQQRLADQARAAMDQLRQRAEQMQKADAAQAQGMRQAEQRGRERQVADKMEQASKAVEENQTSQADADQQEAAEALEEMLQDVQRAQKNRDAALRRILADLMATLEKLIADQQAQIAALDKARPDGLEPAEAEPLVPPMRDLNRATLGAGEAARGDRELARLGSIIDRAAEAQGKAIAALRKSPPAEEDATKEEAESLRLLTQARDEAKRLREQSQQRERDQQRAELRAAYRELLEKQVALNGETSPLVGKTIDRRQRIVLRGLGDRQEEIRAALEGLRKRIADEAEAEVFALAHDRLDESAGLAAKKLRGAVADAATARAQQSTARVLAALVQALDDQAQDPDELREEEGGGGGGGGGGQQQQRPLVPPLAELRLLRGMQQEVLERTRGADDAKDAEEVRRLGDDQKKLAERGETLIQKLKEQSAGGGAPAPKPEGKE